MRNCVSWNKHYTNKMILQVHQGRNYAGTAQKFVGTQSKELH